MAEVIHGSASTDQLNARADKSQVYGLSGNDTLISDSKADVLLIGGSGDDSLIMFGGNGTLSGGKGSDTFELTYSVDKPVSAIIEDLEPSSDKIIVNHVGDTAPQLTSSVKGNDVIWTDGGNFNLTLKSVRENDYFDGDASEQVWEVLELTNAEREAQGLSALTLTDGLTEGASIRAQEIKDSLSHTRPNGTDYSTVFDEVGKIYSHHAENILAALSAPVEVVAAWMSSTSHAANITNPNFLRIGIGYNYNDTDSSDARYYWTQEFADSFAAPDSVSTADLLTSSIKRGAVSIPIITLTNDAETFTNVTYGATIDALGGNDSIANLILNVSISGGDGDDTINNSGVNTTINAGTGNDLIQLGGANNFIEYRAGDGSDIVQGFRADSTLSIAGDEYTPVTVGNDVIVAVGDDSITLANAATLSTVNIIGTRSKLYILTDDDDEIENSIEGATIQALGGDDNVVNTSKAVTIDAGDGDDQIDNQRELDWNEETKEYETIFSADSVSINGGAGDDSIGNDGSYVTINAGAGNDNIDVNGLSSIVDGGTGNDTITGYTNISAYVSIMGGEGDDEISSYWMGDHAYIDGGDGNDSIQNYGAKATILGGTGDDSIHNSSEEVYINAGDGNDSIQNLRNSVTIDTGSGNDYIDNNISESVTIDGGTGNDYIDNSGYGVSISGGTGDDTIDSYAESVTITGGKGNDLISLVFSWRDNNVIVYNEGDGLDTIDGFNKTSTLKIGDGMGTYSTIESGDDVIVSVGRGSILLKDAASFSSSLKISGTLSEPVEVEDNSIVLTDSGTYNNTLDGAIISGESGGYSLANSGDNVSIGTGDGADSISNNGENVSIASGDGNDTISLLSGAQNTLIKYKAGNDLISGFGANDTLSVSGGKYIRSTVGNDVVLDFDDGSVTLLGARSFSYINVVGALSEENNLITLTEYVDTLDNTLEGATILALGGNDTIYNGQDSVSIDGGAGDDSILNGSRYAKNGSRSWRDTISSITLNGGEGNDSIYNYVTNNVTIDGGNGDNYIEDRPDSTNVSIRTGDGNDTIEDFYNSHVTIDSGAGNDSIWGLNGDDSLQIGDGTGTYATQGSGDDVIIIVGEGSITLKDARNKPLPTVLGAQGSSGGTSSNEGNGGDSSGGNSSSGNGSSGNGSSGSGSGGNGSGGSGSGGNGSGGSGSGGNGSGGSGSGGSGSGGNGSGGSGSGGSGSGGNGSSGNGSSGNSSSSDNTNNQSNMSGNISGGNVSNSGNVSNGGNVSGNISSGNTKGNISASGNINTGGSINTSGNGEGYSGGNNASATTFSSPFDALRTTMPVANQHVYAGGNQIINDYQAGEKIIFGATYTGALFDDAGNFLIGSSTGALAITNATDKVIDLLDAAGNAFLKAYAATTAGIIDGRGLAGFEVIKGSQGSDVIFAGDGGSQLWGSADVAADTLVGGNGSDIFIGGKTQGADVFLNASSADIIHLNDATLSDILGTAEANGAIAVAFNTGNVIAVQSSEPLSAAFLLADGSAYRFNHVTKSWQGA